MPPARFTRASLDPAATTGGDVDRTLRRPARVLAALTLLLAGVVLAGWLFDVEAIVRPAQNTAAMTPVAAVAVALLAVAALLAGRARAIGVTRYRTAVQVLAVAGGAPGAIELVTVLAGDPAPLNARLFHVDAEMAHTTAVATVLLAGALGLAADRRRAAAGLARAAAMATGVIASAALLGYALSVEHFYGTASGVQMSPQTAVASLLLAGAVALIAPGPFIRILVGGTLGGRFLRTALPVITAIQVAGAILATAGWRAGLYSPGAAVWLMTLTALACLGLLVARVAVRLHADDLRLTEDARRLEELAARDPLTGGLNRRVFQAEIERTSDRLRRYGGTGAVCVIDLDHFKEVNDTYGHQTGDEALVRVYRALRSQLRSTDVLARIGGDEFAALLPHADAQTTRRVADELRAVVAEVAAELEAEGRPSRLAASIGHALLTGARTAAAVLAEADQRMYRAKRAGRAAAVEAAARTGS